LGVLDDLDFKRLFVGQIENADGQLRQFRDLRGAEPSRSRNDLETFVVGSDGDGLNEAVGA